MTKFNLNLVRVYKFCLFPIQLSGKQGVKKWVECHAIFRNGLISLRQYLYVFVKRNIFARFSAVLSNLAKWSLRDVS